MTGDQTRDGVVAAGPAPHSDRRAAHSAAAPRRLGWSGLGRARQARDPRIGQSQPLRRAELICAQGRQWAVAEQRRLLGDLWCERGVPCLVGDPTAGTGHLVVEGPIDALSLTMAGIPALALVGTAGTGSFDGTLTAAPWSTSVSYLGPGSVNLIVICGIGK